MKRFIESFERVTANGIENEIRHLSRYDRNITVSDMLKHLRKELTKKNRKEKAEKKAIVKKLEGKVFKFWHEDRDENHVEWLSITKAEPVSGCGDNPDAHLHGTCLVLYHNSLSEEKISDRTRWDSYEGMDMEETTHEEFERVRNSIREWKQSIVG